MSPTELANLKHNVKEDTPKFAWSLPLKIHIVMASDPPPKMSTKSPSWQPSGGRLNKKDGLTRYGDSHVKDKTS